MVALGELIRSLEHDRMNRLTLGQIRQSTLPEAIGLCSADAPRIAAYCNEAIQRLIIAGGETGWFGSWAKTAFTVDPDDPYITLPRSIARLSGAVDVCNRPVAIQNEWYEFLEFGTGLQPVNSCQQPCNLLMGHDRGVVVTAVDLDPPGKKLRVYRTDALDDGKRILIQGNDNNDIPIYEQAGISRVDGTYLLLASPFVDTSMEISRITGIQKDITQGPVKIYELDVATQTQRLILTMEPSETLASYRRYFLNGLPTNCCGSSSTVTVTAMAKLEFLPMAVDTDYSLIGNLPALIEECQSIRYSRMDNIKSQQLSVGKHTMAIRLLNKELEHYMGRLKPAVNFAPFGSAKLEHDFIGTLV